MTGLEEEISDFFFNSWFVLGGVEENKWERIHSFWWWGTWAGRLKQKLTVSVMLSKCQILFKALYIY